MPLGGGRLVLFRNNRNSTTIRSLEFVASSSQYLSMLQTDFGTPSRTIFAVSYWYKRASTGLMYVFTEQQWYTRFDTADKLRFNINGGGNLITTDTFTDTVDWHHVYSLYDSTQAIEADRIQIWHDGIRITAFDTETYPALNTAASIASGVSFAVGWGVSTFYYDGLLFDVAFFDGNLGAMPNPVSIYNSGVPANVTTYTSCRSILNLNGGTTVEDDGKLGTNWTNNNGVTANVNIP